MQAQAQVLGELILLRGGRDARRKRDDDRSCLGI